MASEKRPRRDLRCRKPIPQFFLCFLIGLFAGATPAARRRPPPTPIAPPRSPDPPPAATKLPTPTTHPARKLLLVVTVVREGRDDGASAARLGRLGRTLHLVPPPILWILVGPPPSGAVAEELMRSGVVYRYLEGGKANFSSSGSQEELGRQRNVALHHVEKHRMEGIVLFADSSHVYDLSMFQEIRSIEVFGTWHVAWMNEKNVTIEGPICNSSQVLGWHLGNREIKEDLSKRSRRVSVNNFAFYSTILWDPERWGRYPSIPDNSLDSVKFIQQVVMEDKSKAVPIPRDCSRIMVWKIDSPDHRWLESGLVQSTGGRNRTRTTILRRI